MKLYKKTTECQVIPAQRLTTSAFRVEDTRM